MGRILLLVAKRSYRAQAFLDAAERLGVDVVVGGDHRPALGDLVPGHAIEVPLGDVLAGTRTIAEFARTHTLDAVLAAEDDGALLAAHAAAVLGIPHNPPDAVGAARFKHRMRERLATAGVPVPDYRIASAGDDPLRVAAGVPFPAVVKPVALAASRGVIRADDERELAAAFRRVERLLEDPEVAARGGDAARAILIEEYVAGPEVAVEGLLTDGRLEVLAIFDKPDPLEGPTFEETIYVTPCRLPPAAQEAIAAATARTAEALGLVTGPAHAELRLGVRGPV
ncbi:MAG: ATP-grasp domain-containing protein, partial [Gemmatimonadota bacterium]